MPPHCQHLEEDPPALTHPPRRGTDPDPGAEKGRFGKGPPGPAAQGSDAGSTPSPRQQPPPPGRTPTALQRRGSPPITLECKPVLWAHSTPEAPPADSPPRAEPAWAAHTAGLAQGALTGQEPQREARPLVPPPPPPRLELWAPSSSRCPSRAARKKPPAPLHRREGPRALGRRVREPHSPGPLPPTAEPTGPCARRAEREEQTRGALTALPAPKDTQRLLPPLPHPAAWPLTVRRQLPREGGG